MPLRNKLKLSSGKPLYRDAAGQIRTSADQQELCLSLWALPPRTSPVAPILEAVDLVPGPVLQNVGRLVYEHFRAKPTPEQVAAMAEIAWGVTLELDALIASRRRPANPRRRRSML
jgi:hypothetical protein